MIRETKSQTIVTFENGDINIVTGVIEEENIGLLAFREQEPRKIGMNNGDKPKEITGYPIIFNFTNIDSIDVLIKSLEIVKEDMKKIGEIYNGI